MKNNMCVYQLSLYIWFQISHDLYNHLEFLVCVAHVNMLWEILGDREQMFSNRSVKFAKLQMRNSHKFYPHPGIPFKPAIKIKMPECGVKMLWLVGICVAIVVGQGGGLVLFYLTRLKILTFLQVLMRLLMSRACMGRDRGAWSSSTRWATGRKRFTRPSLQSRSSATTRWWS